MPKGEQFDLSQLLNDSLSLNLTSNSHTRATYKQETLDPCEKFTKLGPYGALGEIQFDKQTKVPENVVGTPIQEFFRGVHIFITGGTGFIGKILTEKLVRSVPHLGQIYLLIREKRGKNSQERFEQLLEDPVFRRMRAEVPDYANKLTVVEGDISAPCLGLSAADERTLLDHVTVVFHSAADVRFIEPLRVAVSSNVTGSRNMLTLARGMTKLKSYVHVSTAYSQCVRRVVPETVPKMSVHYKEVLTLIDSLNDEEIEKDLTRILHRWPNTYTFTKAMCEEMLVEEAGGLPISIFRPSAVVNTYREPVRGWTDNMNGPIGMMVAFAMGLLHCGHLDEYAALDMVPGDYTANCMIACAWDSINKVRGKLPVYNYVASPSNVIPWKRYIKYARISDEAFSIQQSIWCFSLFLTENDLIHEASHYLLHKIPGFILDKFAEWNGQKARLSKIYDKLHILKTHLKYFQSTIWEFESKNVQKMLSVMTPEDKALFNFDIRDFDKFEHMVISKLGIRYYYLKEKMETLPQSQRKIRVFCWLHNAGKCLLGLALLKVLVMVAHILPV